MRSANIYCFRAELSAEARRRDTPKVFSPDDPPRPSRQKAGLGLVMIMMMMIKDDDDEYGDLNHVISNHERVDVKARHFLGHVLRDLASRGHYDITNK